MINRLVSAVGHRHTTTADHPDDSDPAGKMKETGTTNAKVTRQSDQNKSSAGGQFAVQQPR